MNLSELSRAVADVTNLPEKPTRATIKAVLALIYDAATRGVEVTVPGFGKFALNGERRAVDIMELCQSLSRSRFDVSVVRKVGAVLFTEITHATDRGEDVVIWRFGKFEGRPVSPHSHQGAASPSSSRAAIAFHPAWSIFSCNDLHLEKWAERSQTDMPEPPRIRVLEQGATLSPFRRLQEWAL